MARDYANAMLGVMDEAMHEARHEGGYRLIEVITGRRKRRDWSDEEKARIVCESAEPDANISAVARRHGVNRGLLNAWGQEPAFVPVNVVDSQRLQRATAFDVASSAAGRIEIELDGARMTVVGSVAPELAQAMLAALRCRR